MPELGDIEEVRFIDLNGVEHVAKLKIIGREVKPTPTPEAEPAPTPTPAAQAPGATTRTS